MRGSRHLATRLLSAAVLFASGAQAMPIEQYDKMATPDRSDYVVVLLAGAQKILLAAGNHEDLAKLNKLFTEVRPGDKMTIGMLQFQENLDRARLLDAQNYAKNRDTTRLEVEHAMILTLKKNGMEVPQSFMHVADTFRPKSPVR